MTLTTEETITCRDCNQTKPVSEFRLYRRATGDKNSRNTSCNTCQKEHERVVTELKKNSPSKPKCCDLCGKERKLVFDHCHKTKVFRGWLCNPCNLGLGNLGDDIESVEKALAYMKGKKNEQKTRRRLQTWLRIFFKN